MPCTLKIRVIQGRDFPVMDSSSKLADTFVTIKFGQYKYETTTARKTLNPHWNHDFRLEIADSALLQDQLIEFKVLDKDYYSADDPIGVVLIDFNCLLQIENSQANNNTSTMIGQSQAAALLDSQQSELLNTGSNSNNSNNNINNIDTAPLGQLNGWFPIYDTFHGIRGQLQLSIKLLFFGEFNLYLPSSVPSVAAAGIDSINDNNGNNLINNNNNNNLSDPNLINSNSINNLANNTSLQSLSAAAGVQFFSVSSLEGYVIELIHGFVEELIMVRDPEYHWTDSFRASRTSNEARQLLFNQLTGKIRRNVGRKCLELGGNAVLGFRQTMDLEAEIGIIARGTGTACTIRKILINNNNNNNKLINSTDLANNTIIDQSNNDSTIPSIVSGSNSSINPISIINNPSISLSNNNNNHNTIIPTALSNLSRHQYRRDIHLITMNYFPPTVQICIGGIVAARSVKLLDTKSANQHTQKQRDQWWNDLRKEIKSHARTLNCTAVIGYSEETTVFEDICVLSAVGTAARCGWYSKQQKLIKDNPINSSSTNNRTKRRPKKRPTTASIASSVDGGGGVGLVNSNNPNNIFSAFKTHRREQPYCACCHIPYNRASQPFRMQLVPCLTCKKKFVPEILLTTIDRIQEPAINNTSANGEFDPIDPSSCDPLNINPTNSTSNCCRNFPILGTGQLIEARICRLQKKSLKGEAHATAVSESIPFLEYDLHRQLIYKLRVMGMNAVLNLKFQLVLGDNLLVAVATGTAVYMHSLPAPPVLMIKRYIGIEDQEDRELYNIQQRLMELSASNRIHWQLILSEYRRNQRKERREGRISGSAAGTANNTNLANLKLHNHRRGGSAINTDSQQQLLKQRRKKRAQTAANAAAAAVAAANTTEYNNTAVDSPIDPELTNTVPLTARADSDNINSANNNNENTIDHAQSAPSAATTADTIQTSTLPVPAADLSDIDESSSGSSTSSSSGIDSEADDLAIAADSNKPEFVLQIDDEADEDMLASILEPMPPVNCSFINTELLPVDNNINSIISNTAAASAAEPNIQNIQMFTIIRRVEWDEWEDSNENQLNNNNKNNNKSNKNKSNTSNNNNRDQSSRPNSARHLSSISGSLNTTGPKLRARVTGLNRLLASIYADLYADLAYKVSAYTPCYIAAIRSQVHLPEENNIEVVLTCIAVKQWQPEYPKLMQQLATAAARKASISSTSSSSSSSTSTDSETDTLVNTDSAGINANNTTPLNDSIIGDLSVPIGPESPTRGAQSKSFNPSTPAQAQLTISGGSSKRSKKSKRSKPASAASAVDTFRERKRERALKQLIAVQNSTVSVTHRPIGVPLLIPPLLNTVRQSLQQQSASRLQYMNYNNNTVDLNSIRDQAIRTGYLWDNQSNNNSNNTKSIPSAGLTLKSLFRQLTNTLSSSPVNSLSPTATADPSTLINRQISLPSGSEQLILTTANSEEQQNQNQSSTLNEIKTNAASDILRRLASGSSNNNNPSPSAVPRPLAINNNNSTTLIDPINNLFGVEFIPGSHFPNAPIINYLGRIRINLIKEIYNYQHKAGSLGNFAHRFLIECNTLARAHVLSRGGNGLIGYILHEFNVIQQNRTQAYAIISLSGDAVRVEKY